MGKKEKKENIENNDDIEVVIGDGSDLTISDVGDIMNNLRPKDSVTNKKNIIIPKAKIDKKVKKRKKNK